MWGGGGCKDHLPSTIKTFKYKSQHVEQRLTTQKEHMPSADDDDDDNGHNKNKNMGCRLALALLISLFSLSLSSSLPPSLHLSVSCSFSSCPFFLSLSLSLSIHPPHYLSWFCLYVCITQLNSTVFLTLSLHSSQPSNAPLGQVTFTARLLAQCICVVGQEHKCLYFVCVCVCVCVSVCRRRMLLTILKLKWAVLQSTQ